MSKIEARNFKGTRDYLPNEMIARNDIVEKIRFIFESYGFTPLKTPALEYLDILLDKYGEDADRLIYRLNYKGGNTAGLRYDLTVPLSRFLSQHSSSIVYPFRRYQIQPVWRADRPQPNQGRFREFYQCDADIIGVASLLADAEILAMTNEILTELDIDDFVIRINNRKLLSGIIEWLGISSLKEKDFLKSLDKLDKTSKEAVKAELLSLGFEEHIISKAFSIIFIHESYERSNLLKELSHILKENPIAMEGIRELEEILYYLSILEIPALNIKLDLSLVRGLDYYTGSIYETSSLRLPHIGSLSGGGRYDKLIGTFSKKTTPAIGSTIGLDRIITLLRQLDKIEDRNSKTEVLIALFDKESIVHNLKLCKALRQSGIKTEMVLDYIKLKKQFAYADKNKIPYVVVCGPSEIKENKVTIKELMSGEQKQVKLSKLIDYVKEVKERKVKSQDER